MYNKTFQVFKKKLLHVVKGDGIYLYNKNKKKFLDTTSGANSFAVLGYNNRAIINAINNQMKKYSHIDHKIFGEDLSEKLSNLMLKNKKNKLDNVYFSGNSGGEANEAAMKLSYLVHQSNGNLKKKWFIGRNQSYHGIGSDNLAIGDRPDLKIFKNFFPKFRAKVPQNHFLKDRKKNESELDYSKRSASYLEQKILQIGPENICGFLGETIMGGLVGDVPPSKNYWKLIRKICDKYNIHLILDEVYCGLGASGKNYCCDYDGVTPDFLTVSKTLTAGYIPLSAVVTKKKFRSQILNKFHRIYHGTTNQGHALGLASAIACQKIINNNKMLGHIYQIGQYMRNVLINELDKHDFFFNVRGRGLRFSFEYNCKNKNEFGLKLTENMLKKNIIVSGKWHRVCFTPPYIITKQQADQVLEVFVSEFKKLAHSWK